MEKKRINRRDFLRLSATAGTGAFLVPDATAAFKTTTVTDVKADDIPVRTLGKTGIKLPILSMGVMRADNPNVVRAAYNSKLYHFDTANGYQNGRNEEMLGAFFEDKPRDSFFISTKVKLDYPLRDDFETSFETTFEQSLRRLRMSYVDLFYAHALETAEQVKDPRIIAELQKIKKSGKARFIGFTTHAHKPDQIHAAVDAGIYDAILVSYNFKLANLKETEEAIERAAKAGIGIVAMKTMTSGSEDASGQRKINAQACLRWAWNNPNITTAIPGFSNFDEFEECLAAAQNAAITTEDRNYLATLCTKDSMYCQQCGKCKEQCPEHLPIPDMMRAYMYAYGYKYANLSKETLLELNLPQTACTTCSGTGCKVNCPSGFHVGEKIAAIMPIMHTPSEFLT